jgi:hypothetical protein
VVSLIWLAHWPVRHHTYSSQGPQSTDMQSEPSINSKEGEAYKPRHAMFVMLMCDRQLLYLSIKAIDLVHPPAFMVASRKVYMVWEQDLVGKQGQDDLC